MLFTDLLEVTAENMTVLYSKSFLIPELGYFGQTVAFQLIRTERAENCYLQRKGERDK